MNEETKHEHLECAKLKIRQRLGIPMEFPSNSDICDICPAAEKEGQCAECGFLVLCLINAYRFDKCPRCGWHTFETTPLHTHWLPPGDYGCYPRPKVSQSLCSKCIESLTNEAINKRCRAMRNEEYFHLSIEKKLSGSKEHKMATPSTETSIKTSPHPIDDLLIMQHPKHFSQVVLALADDTKTSEFDFVCKKSNIPSNKVKAVLKNRERFHACYQKARGTCYYLPDFDIDKELRQYTGIFNQTDYGKCFSSMSLELEYISKKTRLPARLTASVLIHSCEFLANKGLMSDVFSGQYAQWAVNRLNYGRE